MYMKKVEFGYANESNPRGSFEGIGLAEGAKGAVAAEFVDVMRMNGRDYLITKITEAFRNSEQEIGRFDVRRALVDLFPDGSSIMFLDQLHSSDCIDLEELLNSDKAKNLMERGVSVKDICGAGNAPASFVIATHADLVLATAIRHEVFEEKMALLSRCRGSFTDMRMELESLQKAKEEEVKRTF